MAMDSTDSLWIMTRAEIDALRAKVKRSAEVLETTRAISDQRAQELRELTLRADAWRDLAIELAPGTFTDLMLRYQEILLEKRHRQ